MGLSMRIRKIEAAEAVASKRRFIRPVSQHLPAPSPAVRLIDHS